MPAGPSIPQDSSSPANGHSTVHDLFVLTDEQILEIVPEAQDVELSSAQPPARTQEPLRASPDGTEPRSASLPAGSDALAQNENRRLEAGATPSQPAAATLASTGQESPVTSHLSVDPPPWLAAQMKDPWSGEEARELWNGVQQARQEAAAYRAAFANPEDARALKELYPGGVSEARAAAERARTLDDIDRAFFGSAGKSPQEVSVAREQLAQQMLREDPAAFREMVFAGLRALEGAGKQSAGAHVASPFRAASSTAEGQPLQNDGGLKPTATQALHEGRTTPQEARVATYTAFEKAANDELERSVGATIERTLNQALPNVARTAQDASTQAGQAPPLQARLSAAIRQEVEAALKGDRQLGEQVAQILSGKRLDDETRAQVVRLIGERAQQLVPVAVKRVLSDWTQTTLAAHRNKSARAEIASARREVVPSPPAGPAAGENRTRSQGPSRSTAQLEPRRVDYRKLSDEQILEM
jgi:hypothetical protein